MVSLPTMLSLLPPANRVASLPVDAEFPFSRTPLTVAFADRDDLSRVEPGAPVRLAEVPELSSEDAYLLLPLRAREGFLRAFAKGRVGAVSAWFADARVLRGEVERVRGPRLWVGDVWEAAELLLGETAAAVQGDGPACVREVNALPWVRALAHGGLVDAAGVSTLRGADVYVGVSRRGVADLGLGRDAVAPTFVWSERDAFGAHVRVAVSADEDDAVTCLLAPVSLLAGA